MRYSIQMVGVGGQGVLLASTVLGNAAMREGYEVAMSEVHGMAQRGGSVMSTLRFGEGVVSPLAPKGGANVILGFEPVETYRALGYANSETCIITNMHPIVPTMVSMGLDQYPPINELMEAMKACSGRVIPIDATELALVAGKALVANTVLVGAVAAVDNIPLQKEILREVLLERVPEKFVDMNARAFDLGYRAVKDDQSTGTIRS